MPQVDILIPNYNKAAFLVRTLDSLRKQTFTDWQAVVIDNESTDGSWELLQSEVGADPRFRLMQMPRPGATGRSFYATWNALLNHGESPFFSILTSDDTWPADWLEKMIARLKANPPALTAASRVRVIDENDVAGEQGSFGRLFESSFRAGLPAGAIPGDECALRALLLGPVFYSIHSLLLRRAVIDQGLLFAEDLGFAADHEFYLQVSLLGPVCYVPETEACFRLYAAQASSATGGIGSAQLFARIVRRNAAAVGARFSRQAAMILAAAEEMAQRREFDGWAPWSSLRRQPLLTLGRLARGFVHVPSQLCPNLRDRLAGRHYTADKSLEATAEFSQL